MLSPWFSRPASWISRNFPELPIAARALDGRAWPRLELRFERAKGVGNRSAAGSAVGHVASENFRKLPVGANALTAKASPAHHLRSRRARRPEVKADRVMN